MIEIKRKKVIVFTILTLVLIFGTVFAQTDGIKVYVNGLRIGHNAYLIDNLTYIPLRAVSEAMGAEVSWDGNTYTAHVDFSEEDAIAKIVETASPSVVTIVGNYAGEGETFKYNNPTVHGSGVIYKSNGHIITNAHVIENIKNLTVILSDGTSLPGKVLYSDTDADLAIVKIEKLGLTPVSMAEKETVVSGKTAIVIGTPISLSMRNTVTKGIISGSDVTVADSYYKLLQTDAAINPGNSGGPLLNSKGQLIGISSSKFVHEEIDNIGFAIPVDTVKYVISQYEKNGRVIRPAVNIQFEESWEAKIGLPTQKGVTVKQSSDTALESGDIIHAVNGIPVHSIADWNEAIKSSYNGISFTVTVNRNGNIFETEIK